MARVLVTWTHDPTTDVAYYDVSFTVTPAGAGAPNAPLVLKVMRDAGMDANGYSVDYNSLSPTPPALNKGDSVVVTAVSVDSFGQSSLVVTASGSPVVILPPPPTGPVNLMAKQS